MPASSSTKVYARVIGGRREVWCPRCNTFCSDQPTNKVIVKTQCKHCGQVIYWGSIIYLPAQGASPEPDDVLAPLFGEIHPERIRRGQPVNRLRQLSADGLSWTEL